MLHVIICQYQFWKDYIKALSCLEDTVSCRLADHKIGPILVFLSFELSIPEPVVWASFFLNRSKNFILVPKSYQLFLQLCEISHVTVGKPVVCQSRCLLAVHRMRISLRLKVLQV